MATTLQSPGVNVSVVDESFYTPAAPGTVPIIFVATQQDKSNASGTGTAQGTTSANAGKVWVITSQRDLTETFGTPYFETDAEGNPVHGGELNEYGLQAAYSLLGVNSQVYIVRADTDLSKITPLASPPVGEPQNGQYWIDTAGTSFGLFEWDASLNNGRGAFTAISPIVIDDSTEAASLNGSGVPLSAVGTVGDYAMVVSSTYGNKLYYRSATSGWLVVTDNFESSKRVVLSPHFNYPNFTSGTPTGSVWCKMTTPGAGADWDIKKYSSTKQAWDTVPAPLYTSTQLAIVDKDPVGGGSGIALGTVVIDADTNDSSSPNFTPWVRYVSGATVISASTSTTIGNGQSGQVTVRETRIAGTSTVWSSNVAISIAGTVANPAIGKLLAEAINTNSNLVHTIAEWNTSTNTLSIRHSKGGDMQFGYSGDSGSLMSTMGFTAGTTANYYAAPSGSGFSVVASNWKPLSYVAQPDQPSTNPADGTLWYNSTLDADILYNNGLIWQGYRNAFTTSSVYGPIISATKPTVQQDGTTALVTGDIWVDTSTPDEYGRNIYVYDSGAAMPGWIKQDVTDHTSPEGWVFQDARWSINGTSDDASSIADLLYSNYVDPDCPDPKLYPKGTRLFNTRRSGNNVKQYQTGYINKTANSGYNIRTGGSLASDVSDRWVTASPVDAEGVGTFGRLAQRSVVTKALKSMITTNQSIRDTDTLIFNLIATPGYPEVIANMVAFNTDIGQTAFVVGDTPFRLEPTGTALASYGKNSVNATENNDSAVVTYDTSLGMFYPSGFTNDNTGNSIVVPPSHMMLRTIVNSDSKSYLWFAPAGTRRGTVDNASSVGYVDQSGSFKTASLHQGLRDVLSSVKINPIATLPGVGIVNMGQYTRANAASSLDRINVSRLVSYLRRQLGILAKPYLFEPNDSQTRNELKAAASSLLLELVGQRAIYDFVVVCDTTNNTPTRIDRNELYLDIAIEPVKSVEFIYIPLRLLNTGSIESAQYGTQFTGSN